MSCHAISFHVMPCHLMSSNDLLYPAMSSLPVKSGHRSCKVTSCDTMQFHVNNVLADVRLGQVMSHCVTSGDVVSSVTSRRVFSCCVMPYYISVGISNTRAE